MHPAYNIGCDAALEALGFVKTANGGIRVRQRKDPYTEIHRKIRKAFKLKVPKFDMAKLMKRLLTNPLKQPQKQLSGNTPPVKM